MFYLRSRYIIRMCPGMYDALLGEALEQLTGLGLWSFEHGVSLLGLGGRLHGGGFLGNLFCVARLFTGALWLLLRFGLEVCV